MTSLSKNVSIDKLDNIVNKYSKTYHSLIKLKPADVKSSTYIDFDKKNDKEDPEFKVGDHVRIQKYKSIFTKGYVPNWFEEVFEIPKIKYTDPWRYVISDLKGKEAIIKKELKFKVIKYI